MARVAENIFDVIVIGGGVIGCAVLHELTNHGYRCLLVEKEKALVSGASSGNSGIAHVGFDAIPGTLESQCLSENQELSAKLLPYNITTRKNGAIVVAWTSEELRKLEDIENNARTVGVLDVKRLNREELFLMEPNLSREAIGGLLVPHHFFPHTLYTKENGTDFEVKTACKIISGSQRPDGIWLLSTTQGEVKGRVVVNAAGLHGDTIEDICQKPQFSIKPRKGQFVVYSKEAGSLIHHMILPVPSDKTKGVLVLTSAYGNLVVGPTAEDCDERDLPSLSSDVTSRLVEYGQRIIPALSRYSVIAEYGGLRPATESKDYQVYVNTERRWVTAAGIRSTGVSACLAIARHVRRLMESCSQHTGLMLPLPDEKPQSKGVATWWLTADGSSVVMDGMTYEVTHPLSRLGLTAESRSNTPKCKL